MEDFVSFELAKKLKEKGFNQEPKHLCLNSYYEYDGLRKITPLYNEHVWYESENKEYLYYAPIISQVLKWLREEKLILIGLSPMQEYDVEETIEWCATVYKADKLGGLSFKEEYYYESYEQAALAGIEYVLDNLI